MVRVRKREGDRESEEERGRQIESVRKREGDRQRVRKKEGDR